MKRMKVLGLIWKHIKVRGCVLWFGLKIRPYNSALSRTSNTVSSLCIDKCYDADWYRLEFTMVEYSMNLCHGMLLSVGKLLLGVTGTLLPRIRHIR